MNIDNRDTFVSSLNKKFNNGPLVQVADKLIKEAQISPRQKLKYITIPGTGNGVYLKIIGHLYLKYAVTTNNMINLRGFGKFAPSVRTNSATPRAIRSGTRQTHLRHTTPIGRDPKSDPIITRLITSHDKELFQGKTPDEYFERYTIVSYPIDREMVASINNKTSAAANDLTTILSATEAALTYFPMAKIASHAVGIVASVLLAKNTNELNNYIASRVFENVSFGDVLVLTTAIYASDGLTVHAPNVVELLEIIPASDSVLIN